MNIRFPFQKDTQRHTTSLIHKSNYFYFFRFEKKQNEFSESVSRENAFAILEPFGIESNVKCRKQPARSDFQTNTKREEKLE
jgi:hypothetical protein